MPSPEGMIMPGSVLLKLGAAAAVVSVVASGCSSSQSGTSGGAGAPTLVVYSAQGYDAPVTEAFSKATGIQVKLVDDSTGPLLTKIAAEANNPQWGVLWVDGDTAFAALDKQGKLKPYTPSAQFTPVGQALVPDEPRLRAGQCDRGRRADLQRGQGRPRPQRATTICCGPSTQGRSE